VLRWGEYDEKFVTCPSHTNGPNGGPYRKDQFMSVDRPGGPAVPGDPDSGAAGADPGVGTAIPPAAPPDTYPARFDATQQLPRNKGLVLLRCFYVPFLNVVAYLALLPHVLILLVLQIGVLVTWIVSWFTVLFTGRIPRGIFDFEVGVLRWAYRLRAWVFLLTDQYPPFGFDEGLSPVNFTVEYPEEGVPRWRGIPFLSAIMAIPVMIVAEVILIVCWLMMILPPIVPGVIPLLALFGTNGVPDGLYNFVRGGIKLSARAQAYALMLVRPYPTFNF
jgi:hypothetical protein